MRKQTIFRQGIKLVSIFMSVVFLAACSGNAIKMYSGESPGKEKLAYVDSSGTLSTTMSKSAAVVIKKINGNETRMQKNAINPRLEILPGKHTLDIELLKSVSTEVSSTYGSTFKEYRVKKSLVLHAEAGHFYKVYGRLYPELTFPWFLWIEDKTGGKVVAGVKPDL